MNKKHVKRGTTCQKDFANVYISSSKLVFYQLLKKNNRIIVFILFIFRV